MSGARQSTVLVPWSAIQMDKNRSRCGHMSTMIGKDSLGDPLSGEDSLRVDQLEERLEQLRS